MTPFQSAMQDLRNSKSAGKPVQVGNARMKAINNALNAMAEECGLTLAKNIQPQRPGEVSIIAAARDGRLGAYGECGCFGEAFAAWLNQIPVRTGASPARGFITATGGWCYANHFDVEQLVLLYEKNNGQIPMKSS